MGARRGAELGVGSATGTPLTAALLPAVSPAELARSGFWEYLSQLTSDKESPEHGQSSKLGSDSV